MSNCGGHASTTKHSRQPPTGRDQSRQAATDEDYLSIKEALDLFVAHGRAVTERTLQRYCERQHLKGQKRITAEGEKWFVLRSSVLTRIKELSEFDRLRASRQVATSRDVSAPVGEEKQAHSEHDEPRQDATQTMSEPVGSAQPQHTTTSDRSRQDATGRDLSRDDETRTTLEKTMSEHERELYERMLAVLNEQRADLMKDKELLQADKEALLRQLEMKDKQIDRFFTSERDTKTLLGSLQSLVNAIWPKGSKEVGDRYVPMRDALDSGLAAEQKGEGER